jgi:hypothetical protein
VSISAYGPSSPQATRRGKNTSKSLVGRTTCRSYLLAMPEPAAFNRPNRHNNRHNAGKRRITDYGLQVHTCDSVPLLIDYKYDYASCHGHARPDAAFF